mgnify:CR=1 FL=1
MAGGTATVAGTFCQALFAKIFNKCLGKCGSRLHFVARHFFMKISKVPGKVWKKITLCCQAKCKSAEVLF